MASRYLEQQPNGKPTNAPTEYVDQWAENKWMLVTPRVTACIALIGIVCVALEAWKDLQADKRRSVVRSSRIRSSTTTRRNVSILSRIQLFYQIPLLCYTLALALGTTTVPKGQAWGAYGNTATCSLQGMLLQFGLHGIFCWDTVLSATYLMMVRYKVANLRLRSLEKYYHVFIWSFASVMAIVPLSQEMYNFNNTICWLESYPDNCGDQCQRGAGVELWQDMASYLSMLHLFVSIMIMISIYSSIRGLEDAKKRYQASSQAGSSTAVPARSSHSIQTGNSVAQSCATSRSRRTNSRAVGIQGILYASGMLITLFPTALYILLWNSAGLWSDGFAIFATSLVPLIGYVNFCIFMRGRTVESCHTQYAKLLRRAHSWMFDYELHRECQCLPRHRGRGIMGTGRTSIHGVTRSPEPHPSSVHQPTPIDKGIPEGTGEEGDEGVDTVGSLKKQTGPFSGITIKVKGTDNRCSAQYVSELGVSVISEESCEFLEQTHMPPQEQVVDKRPPLKPMRTLSEFLGDFSDGPMNVNVKKPPNQPTRSVSEAIGDSSKDVRKQTAKKPPSKPTRIVSEVLADDSGNTENQTAQLPQARTEPIKSCNSLGNSAPQRPPVRPERHETEVETSNHVSFAPPTIPQRYESECDNAREDLAPPRKRGLFAGFTIRVTRKGNKGNQPVSELGASGMYEEGDSCSSDAECGYATLLKEGVAGKSAPSRPTRLFSELLGNDCGNNPNQSDTAPRAMQEPTKSFTFRNYYSLENSTSYPPPTRPERHETEIELSDNDSESNRQTSPKKPQQYNSKVVPSGALDNSLIPATTTHTAPARIEAPPSLPQRCASEFELSEGDSTSDDNSFSGTSFLQQSRVPPTIPEATTDTVSAGIRTANPPAVPRGTSKSEQSEHIGGTSTIQETHQSFLQKLAKAGVAPSKPERYISEVEPSLELDTSLSHND